MCATAPENSSPLSAAIATCAQILSLVKFHLQDYAVKHFKLNSQDLSFLSQAQVSQDPDPCNTLLHEWSQLPAHREFAFWQTPPPDQEQNKENSDLQHLPVALVIFVGSPVQKHLCKHFPEKF